MTNDQWKQIKYFSKLENWGEPEKLNFYLISTLDAFREYIRTPIIVTSGTGGKHSINSQHYYGLAVDVVMDAEQRGILNILLELTRFPFTGLGVYPKAECRKMARPVGFHLDMRDVSKMERGVTRAQWVGVPDRSGEMQYYGLSEAILSEYGAF